MNDDEAAIRAVIEERAAAMRDKDARRAIATLADEIVAFELAPPLALGPARARDEAGLAGWLAGWGSRFATSTSPPRATSAGAEASTGCTEGSRTAARSTCGCDRP